MRRYRRSYGGYSGWAPYVPVGERRRMAEKEAAARMKKGESMSPVAVSGRLIANTFWGKAWCENLERYGDYENRLPRGRTYVRNGSVIDLRIEKGAVKAQVMGSSLYTVEVKIDPLRPERWEKLVGECAGKVASALELLQGKLSKAVMETITRQGEGLFPEPPEISFRCSCPDFASMCKHVAATLYGVGARLDHAPDLLFLLRGVDHAEMTGRAGVESILQGTAPTSESKLEETDLSGLFGIELDSGPAPAQTAPQAAEKKQPAAAGPAAKRGTAKKAEAARSDAAGEVGPAPGDPVKPGHSTPLETRRVKMRKPRPPARKSPSPTGKSGKEKTPPPQAEIAAKELTAKGVTHATIQQWLRKGILRHSGRRGVYLTTTLLPAALEDYE